VDAVQRYAVSLPGPVCGHRPATVVVVHWTPRSVDGDSVYEDESGQFQFSINSAGVASLLGADDGHQHQCLHAVPLPRTGSPVG
jgi:hypothetical protein